MDPYRRSALRPPGAAGEPVTRALDRVPSPSSPSIATPASIPRDDGAAELPAPPDKDVSLSPPSFADDGSARFLARASSGTALRWAGDCVELGDPEGVPAAFVRLATDRGSVSAIEVGACSPNRPEPFRPPIDATRRG